MHHEENMVTPHMTQHYVSLSVAKAMIRRPSYKHLLGARRDGWEQGQDQDGSIRNSPEESESRSLGEGSHRLECQPREISSFSVASLETGGLSCQGDTGWGKNG